jgi:hypothetical protein
VETVVAMMTVSGGATCPQRSAFSFLSKARLFESVRARDRPAKAAVFAKPLTVVVLPTSHLTHLNLLVRPKAKVR